MKIPSAVQHAEAAEFYVEIRKLGELADVSVPDFEHFVAIAVVRRNAKQAADMIEYHRRLRERAQQVFEIVQLRMKKPGFERQAERLQVGKSLAKHRVEQLVT